MNVHFISMGGSIMHNLAIALKKKGYRITGSDDEIFDPARSRLLKHGLLPAEPGWFPEKITADLDFVVLGMHAKQNNPELEKAVGLGLKIVSFPEFIYEQSRDKQRIVIAGSHGKTSITAMLMHVLRRAGFDYDYLVGSGIEGFEDSVKLSEDAPYMIIEGDEYLTSPLDPRPKFLWYKPGIALISGVAWDHYNVFPTFDIYTKQFELFLGSMPEGSRLVYFQDDEHLPGIISGTNHVEKIPYAMPDYSIEDNRFVLQEGEEQFKMNVFGSHNMLNMNGVAEICRCLGLSRQKTFAYLEDFKGAGKRLELFRQTDDYLVFRDFAHAPSKVRATINGVKEQFRQKRLLAYLELHTYSSLNKGFLPEYKDSMKEADIRVVYINPHAVKLKGLDMLTAVEIRQHFNDEGLSVFFDRQELIQSLQLADKRNAVILMMSSGNFDNLDFGSLL